MDEFVRLEDFIRKLSWGERAEMAAYLGVSKATITNYSLPNSNKRKIKPRPEKVDLIEKFALSKGKLVTLEDIYGEERAALLKNLGKGDDRS